tara:strand:- start:4440 stop:5393 length:954 start_codon:yes stop_codon:yes gene_type:complete
MELSNEILRGNISALAKGITLVESTLLSDQKKAQQLLKKCSKKDRITLRIGITGSPGVGKSTFIETFGELLTKKGKKVAVLAIDPSSEKTKGSILGDKSRMNKLSSNKNAFIRPSPSSGTLGGVTNKTRDSILLCEAAGFDTILIETVGVGQSETTVSNLVDVFLLLMLAGSGDELQGIKRGIMEVADAIAITKADGDNIQKAKKAALEYKNAIHLFPPMENGWIPQVTTCSAVENIGISQILENIEKFNRLVISNGWKEKNRIKQSKFWLHLFIKEEFGNQKYNNLLSEGKIKLMEEELLTGKKIYQLINSVNELK